MFIGRENELSKLNRMYKSDKFEMAIIYGRRRVGKTTLINEFCKDKDTVFFPAIESNAEQNLEILSGAISYLQNGESNAEFKYKSFADAFSRLEELSQNKRIIFVIDEYPYLAKADKSISSVLQRYIDHNFKKTK
ncbi:MAG: ATP-binding protein, partial [Eubacteriales bacterium]|nr:ATP-binding protein [Eubacteriales bacterium]